MASGKEYLDYIIDCLSEADDIAFRAMMGENILYCRGRVIGGIYDDRFLIKPTPSVKKLIPDAKSELPYEGAKEMLLVENTDDREFMAKLVNAAADDLPAPKKNPKE
jgi:TfoX/Sxy family transcriptional regulator of competence genes